MVIPIVAFQAVSATVRLRKGDNSGRSSDPAFLLPFADAHVHQDAATSGMIANRADKVCLGEVIRPRRSRSHDGPSADP